MSKATPQEKIDYIRKMYEDEPNKAKIARMLGVSVRTVYRALGKEDPESQREKRREAMGRITGTMTDRIEALLDSVREIPANASYTQRMVAIGILSDKVEKMDKRMEDSTREDMIAALPIPETVEAMAAALRNEIRQVNLVLQIVPEGPKVIEEARQLEDRTGQKLIEAEFLDIADLDGGK